MPEPKDKRFRDSGMPPFALGRWPVRVIDHISSAINGWIEYLLFGLGLSMAVIVALQVFFRYALNQSLFWSEELARYLLVWLTFLGASVAYRRNAHPGIDFLYTRMPQPLRKACRLATHLAAIALFLVMVVWGCQFAYFVRLQISPALHLPKWAIMGIIPVSGAVLTLHALSFLANDLGTKDHDR